MPLKEILLKVAKPKSMHTPRTQQMPKPQFIITIIIDTNGQNPLQRGKTEAISTFHYYKAS